MFKIESYLTPYLLSYFDKYIKDFKTEDSKLSLWEGGATFNNLNLNLESLENETTLPLKFVSGHIHELRINVPWTKLTSEPIHLKIKTIELNMSLKKSNAQNRSNRSSPATLSETPPPEPETPPSYIQSLFNKIVTNLFIECENVIIKFVEENIVFSLNIKAVSYSTVDQEWKSGKILEILPPEHLLRNKLSFTDITVCLDKCNSSGKVEFYQEPLLYKYSFDVRFTQQYQGPFSRSASLSRMEIVLRDMKFSMTDEQVVMLIRIYYLLNFVGRNEYDQTEVAVTDASTLLQMSLGHFQLVIHEATEKSKPPCNRLLVFDVRDISTTLEMQYVYTKLTFKIMSITLGLFERLDTERFEIGKCLEVLISSGQELTKNISIIQTSNSSITIPSLSTSQSSSNLASSRSSKSTVSRSKPRGFLVLNYTKVQSKDFYKKSESTSPMTKWNQILQEEYDKDFQFSASDNHEYQYLVEYDLKIRGIDIVLNPSILRIYHKILEGIGSLRPPTDHFYEDDLNDTCVVTPYNNNYLPLIYVETEEIRLFLHLETIHNNASSPNAALFQMNSILVQPQADNPLNRSIIKQDLYDLAERAKILNTPGSPIENRQYQIDVQGVSFISCYWDHVDMNSKKLLSSNRIIPASSIILDETAKSNNNKISPNEPPTFSKIVLAHPILNRIDISITCAPAIVYARDPEETCTFLTIAGYAFELNISNDIMIYLNSNQVNFLKEISTELSELLSKAYPDKQAISSKNSDPNSENSIQPNENHLDSNNISSRKKNPVRFLGHNHNHDEVIPQDMLITAKSIHIHIYEVTFFQPSNAFNGEKSSLNEKYSPLGYLLINQPHSIISISKNSQKAEFTFFQLELSVTPTNETFYDTIPENIFCTKKIIYSTTGEINPKTRMVPPFFTLSISDFEEYRIALDLKRGIHVNINEEELRKLEEIIQCFKVESHRATVTEIEQQQSSSFSLAYVEKIHSIEVNFMNFYFAFNDNITLPTANVSFSLSSGQITMFVFYKLTPKCKRAIEKIQSEISLQSFNICTTYANRKDILLNPWNLRLNVTVSWILWAVVPYTIVSADFSPITLNIGSENILAILHLYKTLGIYMIDLLKLKDETISEILETKTIKPTMLCFEDDLRNGSFQYIQTKSSLELPGTYQIAFSNSDLTMTWRYPTPRVVTKIDSKPIPLDTFESKSLVGKTLNCVIEYWDDSRQRFIHFGKLYLSDQSSANVEYPKFDELHYNPSLMWRIIIISPINDDFIKTELLAASLIINSQVDPSHIPRVKLHVRSPKIQINFVNQLSFIANHHSIKLYESDIMNVPDQTFAKLEFKETDCHIVMWYHRCQIKLHSKFRFDVVEYGHLTENNIIDESEFDYAWIFTEETKGDIITYFEVKAKPTVIKIGSSALHSLTSSILNAKYLLMNINSHLYSHPKSKKLTKGPCVDVVETLICNDTEMTLGIKQEDIGNYDHFYIRGRHCLSYIWPKPKNRPECKLGRLQNQSWEWSNSLCLGKCGYSDIKLFNRNLFISITPLTSYQKLVKIYGPISVANVLDNEIQVAYLLKGSQEETISNLSSRSHGPSQVFNESDLEHIRIRMKKEPCAQNYPWSSPFTIKTLQNSKNNKISLSLYEESKGSVKVFNVWCSLIQEETNGSIRYLVVICPFFRVRSLLPYSTTVRVSSKAKKINDSFTLKGKGQDIQIDFRGNPDSTHILTFQTSPSSASLISIPVAPDGPASINERIVCSIESILDHITNDDDSHKNEKALINTEYKWPYIPENLEFKEWINCRQPEAKLEIQYKHWIDGIPTVLIDSSPKALCINLTGVSIAFSSSGSITNHIIPSPSAFSPYSYEEKFRLGIGMKEVSEIIWSDWLEITFEKSRLDIHPVDGNNKVPIDSYSRLEIKSANQTYYLTIEARIRDSITVILIIRPTFSLLNRTSHKLCIKGVNLTKRQNKEDWQLIDDFSMLNPTKEDYCVSLLKFLNDTEDKNSNEGVKFLAVRLNVTWYFVRLFKSGDICNRAISDGISGQRITFALPDYATLHSHATRTRDLKLLRQSTIPLVLNWSFKNGQFWMLLLPDPSPNVTVCNFTDLTFLYDEAGSDDEPIKDNPYFDQFLLAPPSSKVHLSFKNINEYPRIGSREEPPCILLKTFNFENNTNLMNLLGFDSKNWLKKIKLDEDNSISQSLRISDVVDIKLELEKFGSCYYIFIEYMSNEEVSAKTVRGRISKPPLAQGDHQDKSKVEPILMTQDEDSMINKEGEVEESIIINKIVDDPFAPKKQYYGMSLMQMISKMGTIALQSNNVVWSCRAYVPEVYVVITNDKSCSGEKNIFMTFSFMDIFYERNYDETDKRKYKEMLNSRMTEDTLHQFYIGDIQLDSPFHMNGKHDFSVILKQEKAYQTLLSKNEEICDLEEFFTTKLPSISSHCMVECLVYFGPNMRDIKNLWLKFNPFILNVEDYLFECIFPTLYSIYSLWSERHVSISEFSEYLSEMPMKKNSSRAASSLAQFKSGLNPTVSSASDIIADRRARTQQSPSPQPPQSQATPLHSHQSYEVFDFSSSETNLHDSHPSSTSSTPIISSSASSASSSSSSTIRRLVSQEQLKVPDDICQIFDDIGVPFRINLLMIEGVTVYLTVRMVKKMYLALDNSPLHLRRFHEKKIITTWYGLGQMLSNHYFLGTVFESANSLSLLGSLELLGSPTNLARNLSLGLRDFVVYPYHGLFKGPIGFIIGLHYGCSSLVRHIASGTLTSVTNLAWSVSRNIDRLTLDEDEIHYVDDARRQEYYGFVGGFLQGLSGFGIRLLGALGGIAHSPMQSVIQNGASTRSFLKGMSKGVIGAVTRPIGGAVELVAITGQSLLAGAGWSHNYHISHQSLHTSVETANSTMLRYNWRLVYEVKDFGIEERLLIVAEAKHSRRNQLESMALILTNQKLHILSNKTDEFLGYFPLSSIVILSNEESGLLSLRPFIDEYKESTSLAEERLIQFVRESSSSVSNYLPGVQNEDDEENPTTHSPASNNTNTASTCSMNLNLTTSYAANPRGKCSLSSTSLLSHNHHHNVAVEENNSLGSAAEGQHGGGSSDEELLEDEEEEEGEATEVEGILGDFLMDPMSKVQFVTIFNWARSATADQL